LVISGPAGPWSSSLAVFSPSNGTWLKLSPSSGSSLPDPSIDAATPIVSIDPTGLSVGTYNATITVITAGGTSVINVTLQVVSSTIILPNPAGTLIFTAQAGQAKPAPQGLFWSDSDYALSLSTAPVTATTSNPWITLTGAAQGTVTVYVDHTGLAAGVYSGSITLTQTGAANSPTVVPVLLVVVGSSGGGAPGTLTFSPTTLAFTSANGVVTPDFIVLSVGAAAQTSFVAVISYPSGSGSWLSVSPLSGTTAVNLSVSVDPTGLTNGSYT